MSKPGIDVLEVGIVMSVRKSIVVVSGLPSCMDGQVVEFEGACLAS